MFCDLILLRDNTSYEICRKLKIRTPFIQVPDTAFYMPIQNCAKSDSLIQKKLNSPIIGISVSYQLMSRVERYIDYMSSLIKDISQRLNAIILIFPNEVVSNVEVNDLHVAEKILSRLALVDAEIINIEMYTAEEYKAIRGVCDAMVCSRYHSLIAALSCGVPALALSWHHKYSEAMKLFELEPLTIEGIDFNDHLSERFFELYENRKIIREKLLDRRPEVIRAVSQGSRKLFEIIMQRRNAV